MLDKKPSSNAKLTDLIDIMAQLRDPKLGCPWDLGQNFETIAPYTIEEAYEVAEAIEKNDMEALKDELGDVLFQVAFHSRMAEEQGSFKFDDVINAICDKLTRRHPHVFDGLNVEQSGLAKQWESHKRDEKKGQLLKGLLGEISASQPAMNQACKLQKKAASVGFDWASITPVIEKLDEEIAELKVEISASDSRQRIEEELGDVLFSCINLARHLNIDAEWSLRRANKRFSNRFAFIERTLHESNQKIEDCSLTILSELWDKAKINAP